MAKEKKTTNVIDKDIGSASRRACRSNMKANDSGTDAAGDKMELTVTTEKKA